MHQWRLLHATKVYRSYSKLPGIEVLGCLWSPVTVADSSSSSGGSRVGAASDA
ncbi:unnamed protein product [Chrysoparadoxa australica]